MTTSSPDVLAERLAERLDALVEARKALVHECERYVVASEMSAESARQVALGCERLGWACALVDSENNAFEAGELDEAFAPFRATVSKVLPDGGAALYLLTRSGFCDWLAHGHPAREWRLARITGPLVTQGRIYGDWHAPLPFTEVAPTRSPRSLVRETSTLRCVPEDVRFWLMQEGNELDADDPLHRCWAAYACHALVRSLTNELDGDVLVFRGPPSLRLSAPSAPAMWPAQGFAQLQAAGRWVYELPREAELRHTMLATEIARSGRDEGLAPDYLQAHLGLALEGARLTYQMYLGDVTAQTLTALSSLRSNVTEEAGRATEATHKAIGAIGVGLSLVLGLFAARVGVTIDPWIVTLVIAGGVVYTANVVWSGARFIHTQGEQLDAWYPRLYRHLPRAEYQRMVRDPHEASARTYWLTALIGLTLVAVMGVVLIVLAFSDDTSVSTPPPAAVPEAQENVPMPKPGDALLWSTAFDPAQRRVASEPEQDPARHPLKRILTNPAQAIFL